LIQRRRGAPAACCACVPAVCVCLLCVCVCLLCVCCVCCTCAVCALCAPVTRKTRARASPSYVPGCFLAACGGGEHGLQGTRCASRETPPLARAPVPRPRPPSLLSMRRCVCVLCVCVCCVCCTVPPVYEALFPRLRARGVHQSHARHPSQVTCTTPHPPPPPPAVSPLPGAGLRAPRRLRTPPAPRRLLSRRRRRQWWQRRCAASRRRVGRRRRWPAGRLKRCAAAPGGVQSAQGTSPARPCTPLHAPARPCTPLHAPAHPAPEPRRYTSHQTYNTPEPLYASTRQSRYMPQHTVSECKSVRVRVRACVRACACLCARVLYHFLIVTRSS
jgi:hypothetical protein